MFCKQLRSSFTDNLIVIIIIIVVLFYILFIIVVVIIIIISFYLLSYCPARSTFLATICFFSFGTIRSNILVGNDLLIRAKQLIMQSQVVPKIEPTVTFSYFSLCFIAFCSYGDFSFGESLDHISPSFFATSPIVMPGLSVLTFGRWSEQKTKKADLMVEEKKN